MWFFFHKNFLQDMFTLSPYRIFRCLELIWRSTPVLRISFAQFWGTEVFRRIFHEKQSFSAVYAFALCSLLKEFFILLYFLVFCSQKLFAPLFLFLFLFLSHTVFALIF